MSNQAHPDHSSGSTTQQTVPIRWLNTFAHSVRGSLTDLHYYVDVLNSSVWFSFRVVLFFYILLGIVLTASFMLFRAPALKEQTRRAAQQIAEQFPAFVNVTWNGQQLELHPEQTLELGYPLSIAVPDSLPEHLAIFTPEKTGPTQETSSLFFVTPDTLYINRLSRDWESTSLKNLIDSEEKFTIERGVLLELLPSVSAAIDGFFLILPGLLFPYFSLGLLLSRLVMIMIDAFILQIGFYVNGKRMQYYNAFKLCLHLLIPTELITQFTSWIYPELTFPIQTFAFWCLAILLLWHMRHLQAVILKPGKKKEEK